jgi:hypothetical protein
MSGTGRRREFVPVPAGVSRRMSFISVGAASRIAGRTVPELEAIVAKGNGPDVYRGPRDEMMFREADVREWVRLRRIRRVIDRSARRKSITAAVAHAEAIGFTSKTTGVYWSRKRLCWDVRIRWGGAPRFVGSFVDETEASACALSALAARKAGVTFADFAAGDYDESVISTRAAGHFPMIDDAPVVIPRGDSARPNRGDVSRIVSEYFGRATEEGSDDDA